MRLPAQHWLRQTPAAHRGLHDLASGRVENSASAFEAAARAGYAIECDLQQSRDGEAMVFHDPVLERLTSDKGRLIERNAAEICQLNLTNSHDQIQRLGEFLEQISGRVPLLIELKNSRLDNFKLEERTSELLKHYRGDVAVMSFNPRSMAWFAAHHPGLLRGQLSQNYTAEAYPRLSWFRRYVLSNLLLTTISKPNFIGYDIKGLPSFAPTLARKMGLPILAWTVRTSEDLETARRCVDNIIFEKLDSQTLKANWPIAHNVEDGFQ